MDQVEPCNPGFVSVKVLLGDHAADRMRFRLRGKTTELPSDKHSLVTVKTLMGDGNADRMRFQQRSKTTQLPQRGIVMEPDAAVAPLRRTGTTPGRMQTTTRAQSAFEAPTACVLPKDNSWAKPSHKLPKKPPHASAHVLPKDGELPFVRPKLKRRDCVKTRQQTALEDKESIGVGFVARVFTRLWKRP